MNQELSVFACTDQLAIPVLILFQVVLNEVTSHRSGRPDHTDLGGAAAAASCIHRLRLYIYPYTSHLGGSTVMESDNLLYIAAILRYLDGDLVTPA